MTHPLPIAIPPGPNVIVHKGAEISDQAKEDLAQWLEGRGIRTPLSQVVGFAQSTPSSAPTVQTAQTLVGADQAFQDLATIGPQITGLPDGKYVIIFGARLGITTNPGPNRTAYVGVKIDGTEATQAESLQTDANVLQGQSLGLTKTLSGAGVGGHTITMRYSTATAGVNVTATFASRWLIVVREGNA